MHKAIVIQLAPKGFEVSCVEILGKNGFCKCISRMKN